MVTTKSRLQKLAGLLTEAHKTGGKRAWNKIMKLFSDADQKGLVQDIGQKSFDNNGNGLPVHVHEFAVDGIVYAVVAVDDLQTLQDAYENLMDSDHPMGISW